MSGTLTFCSGRIPKRGEDVYIIVDGKSFPTGVWKGVLTYVGDINIEHTEDQGMVEFHTMCVAQINDTRVSANWKGVEPRGSYDVYPRAPGMGAILNKLHDQKAEVKALKRQIEERKKFLAELVQIMKKSLGVEINVLE